MAAISGVSGASAAYSYQALPQPKPIQSQPVQDSVHLSKAALAALHGGGDADHDGDSR